MHLRMSIHLAPTVAEAIVAQEWHCGGCGHACAHEKTTTILPLQGLENQFLTVALLSACSVLHVIPAIPIATCQAAWP